MRSTKRGVTDGALPARDGGARRTLRRVNAREVRQAELRVLEKKE
jgi:hypothetical protein